MQLSPERAGEQDVPVAYDVFGQAMEFVDVFEYQLRQLGSVVVSPAGNKMHHCREQANNDSDAVKHAVSIP
jgi:hypothetical protein